MYAALLGLVFASSAMALWRRAAALGASFAGIAAIYLSQVRVSLIVAMLMFAAYFAILMTQQRKSRAVFFGGAAAAIAVATFLFSLSSAARASPSARSRSSRRTRSRSTPDRAAASCRTPSAISCRSIRSAPASGAGG